MKDFFHDAQTIINKELLLINQKIKSTTFLEILKFKLIDNKPTFGIVNVNLDQTWTACLHGSFAPCLQVSLNGSTDGEQPFGSQLTLKRED